MIVALVCSKDEESERNGHGVIMQPSEYTFVSKVSIDVTLGYKYFMDKSHPLANKKTGKVYHHRHVASVKYGRWLKTDEHVHHINEIKTDNDPENLLVVTQEEHQRIHKPCSRTEIACPECKLVLIQPWDGSVYCSAECFGLSTRKFNPSREEMLELVRTTPATKIAEKFGVSGSAVKKRCKIMGIQTRPRGYWTPR